MTETIDMRIPHRLGKEEARSRIESGLMKMGGPDGALSGVNVQAEHAWQNEGRGDVADVAVQAMGQSITGRISIFEDHVEIRIALPWLLAKLAGVIRPKIEDQTRRTLELPA